MMLMLRAALTYSLLFVQLHCSLPTASAVYLRRRSDDAVHKELVRAINEQRRLHGRSMLCSNRKLQVASQTIAHELAEQNKFDQVAKSSAVEVVNRQRFAFTGLAEDVGVGHRSVQSVVDAWMKVDDHRSNILGNYGYIGTGYAYNGGWESYGHHWVLVLASNSVTHEQHEECDPDFNS